MGRGGYGTERWATQNVLIRAVIQQIGQIGRAAAELTDGQGGIAAGQLTLQVGGQRRLVEVFVRADGDSVHVMSQYPVSSVQSGLLASSTKYSIDGSRSAVGLQNKSDRASMPPMIRPISSQEASSGAIVALEE